MTRVDLSLQASVRVYIADLASRVIDELESC